MYIRECSFCDKAIQHVSYNSWRRCLKNNTKCRECGLIIRKQNNAERDKKLVDENGFIFKPKINLSDKTVNCWKVLNFSDKRLCPNGYFYYWNVECTNCGSVSCKETSHINKTKRCRYCHQMKKGETGCNRLFDTYRRHAKSAKRDFLLDLKQFQQLTSSNCYYCNATPSKIIGNNNSNKISHWGDYVYNGIDRIDNFLGYTINNCVPCCEICNWAKSNRGVDEFKQYINNICKNALAGNICFINQKMLSVE